MLARVVDGPMKSAFITGHTGFTGGQLVAYLTSCGYTVHGLSHSEDGDIRDAHLVESAVRDSRPDAIFHLAAAPKAANPYDQYEINVLGTFVLLEAATKLRPRPTVVLVSSSSIYGRTPVGQAVSEHQTPRPLTHYGTSKLAQEQVARRYAATKQLRVVLARPFNLLGPGMPTTLVCGAVASAIAEIEKGAGPPAIRLGNLRSKRDFTDIRDAVRAYVLLAERGRSGTAYNVCSGAAVSVDRCVKFLLGLSTTRIKVEFDDSRVQPDDLPEQFGDRRRLQELTGWAPEITLEQSLADTLNHARQVSA
jgi:GDP-4-dehydro-6-deoxy-D-mannose reductase